jgi:hypothetical protein
MGLALARDVPPGTGLAGLCRSIHVIIRHRIYELEYLAKVIGDISAQRLSIKLNREPSAISRVRAGEQTTLERGRPVRARDKQSSTSMQTGRLFRLTECRS